MKAEKPSHPLAPSPHWASLSCPSRAVPGTAASPGQHRARLLPASSAQLMGWCRATAYSITARQPHVACLDNNHRFIRVGKIFQDHLVQPSHYHRHPLTHVPKHHIQPFLEHPPGMVTVKCCCLLRPNLYLLKPPPQKKPRVVVYLMGPTA